MDRDAWWAAVRGVCKSQTQQSDWTELIEESNNIVKILTDVLNMLLLLYHYYFMKNTAKQCAQCDSILET